MHMHSDSTPNQKLASCGWRPSKFTLRGGRWRAAPGQVAISSRLMANLAIENYEIAIRRFARGDLADFGCGNAPLAGLYAPLVDTITWIDWPSSMHGDVQLDLSQDLNQPITLPDAQFDTVIMTDVLEHIWNPEGLMGEICRVTRPGGHVIIGVPFLYWLHEEPNDFHRFTVHRLRNLAAIHGFEIVLETENGGGLDVVQDLLTKFSYFRKMPVPAYMVHYGMGAIRRVLRGYNRTLVARMPMGYTFVFKRN